MKVTGTESRQVTINLDDSTIKKVVIAFIEKKFDVRAEWFIRGRKVYYDVEYHTSHSWTDEVEVVRKFTKDQLNAIRFLKSIR